MERQLVSERNAHVCKNAPVSEHEQYNHSRTSTQDCQKERFNIDVLPRPLFVCLSGPPPPKIDPILLAFSSEDVRVPSPSLVHKASQSISPESPQKKSFQPQTRPAAPFSSVDLIQQSTSSGPVLLGERWWRRVAGSFLPSSASERGRKREKSRTAADGHLHLRRKEKEEIKKKKEKQEEKVRNPTCSISSPHAMPLKSPKTQIEKRKEENMQIPLSTPPHHSPPRKPSPPAPAAPAPPSAAPAYRSSRARCCSAA